MAHIIIHTDTHLHSGFRVADTFANKIIEIIRNYKRERKQKIGKMDYKIIEKEMKKREDDLLKEIQEMKI